ncbi:hypothetical protein E2C01_057583 [Portunus trituberculatus]|uniref:Uncharacterized protein n=1 Tax=Portunus trituberculatus TaxID=210409 RepID=A0A5B7H0E5_PORTR|nr:hypothetical protein [Portunus trituberculatus]
MIRLAVSVRVVYHACMATLQGLHSAHHKLEGGSAERQCVRKSHAASGHTKVTGAAGRALHDSVSLLPNPLPPRHRPEDTPHLTLAAPQISLELPSLPLLVAGPAGCSNIAFHPVPKVIRF